MGNQNKEGLDLPDPSLKNMLITGLTIIVILLLFFVFLRGGNPCTQAFPPESNQWCTEEDEWYIGALDCLEMDEEGYVEAYKSLVRVTVNSTYNYDDPPIEVYGHLDFWEGDMWGEGYYLNFPFEGFYDEFVPLIPITYNDYSVTEDLIYESLANIIEYSEGNYAVLNFSITSQERYVTMTVENHVSMPFYNASTDYTVDGYYYGVEYELECWLDYNSTAVIYLDIQIVSECHSGIPLFQSYIFATWVPASGWIATSIFSLKTIITSIELEEV